MQRIVSACLPAVVLVMVALGAASTRAQDPEPYTPQLNQPGKDVQWVPTPPALVEKMLDMANVGPRDLLVDLGSGDGVLVIAAAKRGARARGIEYDARLVEFSKKRALAAGVNARTEFVRGDVFKANFSDATVVTTFLLPSMNLRLQPTFLALKPGTRIVANTFGVGEWMPDGTATIAPCDRWCTAMLWIVPARVGGTWRTPKGDLTLTQRFQFVTGTFGTETIEDGRLHGAELSFTAGATTYSRARGRLPDAHERDGRWEGGGVDGATRATTLSACKIAARTRHAHGAQRHARTSVHNRRLASQQ